MDYLNRVKIQIEEQKLIPNNYDKINMYYINLAMTNANLDYDVIIHPTRQLTLIYYIIAAALSAYEMDLTDVSSELINNLQSGDRVKVQGCLGEYLGKDVINNTLMLKIKFKNMKYYLPPECIWKLSKYEGNASVLNNFGGKNKKIRQKGKNVLANIFEIDKKEHSVIQKKKVIVVTKKKFAINIIKETKLNGIPFTRVFPTAYYSSETNIERIGRDPNQRNPIICFASDFSVASNITDIDTGLVLIDGSYFTVMPTVQMEKLITNEANYNVITLMNSIQDDTLSVLNRIGMNIYRWDKESLQQVDLEDNVTGNTTDRIKQKEFLKHNKYLYNFANHNYEILKISTEDSFNKIRNELLENLEYITENSYETPVTNKFIRLGYFVLFCLQNLACPMSFVEGINNISKIFVSIEEMERIIYDVFIKFKEQTNEDLELLHSITVSLNKLIQILDKENNKAIKLIEILKEIKKPSGVVVRRKSDQILLKKWLEKDEFHYVSVLRTIELKQDLTYENLIFTGWFKEIKGYPLRTELAKRHIFIIYDFEQDYLNSHLRHRENNIRRVPSILKKFESDNKSISSLDEIVCVKEVEESEKEDISIILSDLCLSYARLEYTHNSSAKSDEDSIKYEEAYLVDFVEEYYAYLTEGFRAHVLSRNEEKVIVKPVRLLQEGDELVFSIHNQGDIFEELVSRIEEKDLGIKEIKEMADLWQVSLNNYIKNQNKDISFFVKQLQQYGYSRVEATVENWLNNFDQIAPGEYGIIDVIAKITGDSKLKQNLDEVKEACKILRKLHVQLGRYIAKTIINSYFSVIDEESTLFDFQSINPADYALVVTLSSLSSTKQLVPGYQVNNLIEKF